MRTPLPPHCPSAAKCIPRPSFESFPTEPVGRPVRAGRGARLYVEPTSGESTSPGTLPGGVQPGPFPCVVARTFTHPACESGEDLLMTVLEVRRSLMVWPSHTDCVRASRPRKSRSSPPPFSHRNLAPTNQSFLPRFLLSFASFHNDSIASSFTH